MASASARSGLAFLKGWLAEGKRMSEPMAAFSATRPLARDAFMLTAFGGTHQGRVRPLNEDRFLVRHEAGLFAVADGMGGHAHGDVASSAIVTELAQAGMPSGPEARAGAACGAVDRANGAIRDLARANGNMLIGSTMVALLATGDAFTVLWCGDSRAYRLREGRAERLTRDHSEVEMLLSNGTITEHEALTWPRRNAIIHAVGVSQRPHIDRKDGTIRAGDAFVLCSDGLTTHVDEDEIAGVVAQGSAEGACRSLIRLALERGGTDNVSVIVVRSDGSP